MPLQSYQTNVGSQIGQSRGVNAPATEIASRQLQSLAGRLESFSGSMAQRAARDAKIVASDMAIKDMGDYKIETNRIIADQSLSESDRVKKLQQLQESHEYDGWGIAYKEAYKTTFDASYANTVTKEANTVSNLITSSAKGNSSDYINAWTNYSDSIVKAAPTPALAATSRLTLAETGSKQYKSLATAEWKADEALRKKSSEETLEQLSLEYQAAFATQDLPTIGRIMVQHKEALKSAVDSKFITQKQADTTTKVMNKEATIGRVKYGFEQAQQSGTEANYLSQVYNAKGINAILTASEKDKLVSDLVSSMSTKLKIDQNEQADYKLVFEKNKKRAEENLNKAYVYGELSNSQIDEDFKSGYITKAEATQWYDVVESKGVMVKDMTKELSIRASILAYSNNQILKDNTLRNDQKKDLLAFKEKQQNSASNKWTSSVEGKNSIERIKNNWKELQVTLPGMKVSKRVVEDFNNVYNTFMNEMLKLPEEQRVSRAIPMADSILSAYKEKEFERKQVNNKDAVRTVAERKEKRIESEAKAYRDSLTEQHRQYYDIGVAKFRDSFGNTGVINFGGTNKDVQW